jgi:hypothetical protein
MGTKDEETSSTKGGSVQRKLLTREEVANVLGVTYQRVCQLHRQGKLRPIENREASSGPNRGFVYRREDVERLRDTRHGASGSIAAAAFEIFTNGGRAADVVMKLHIPPEKAILLQKAYVATTNDVLVPAYVFNKFKEAWPGVTREDLPEIMSRMLASVRACRMVISRNGLAKELKITEQQLRREADEEMRRENEELRKENEAIARAADESEVLTALRVVASREPPGALLSVRALRGLCSLTKTHFDMVVLRLSRAGRVVLHHHDSPASLPEADRAELIEDERGIYYIGIVPGKLA